MTKLSALGVLGGVRLLSAFAAATSCAAILLFGASSLASQPAAARAVTHKLSIPAQDMGEALKVLSVSADEQLLFSEQLVTGKQSTRVEGQYTTDQALDILLKGSGLKADRTPSGVVLIRTEGGVNSINKLDGKDPLGGNSQDCSGISSNKLDSATTLNWTDSDSTAIGWTGSDGASDCGDGRLSRNQVLASGERSPVQNSDGESSLNKDLTQDQKLEEIVVTAQKREEKLQDVPISISVVSGADLDKSTALGITETLSRIPGVAVNESLQGGGTSITIRGVSVSGAILGGASPSAYYIDSVPFGFIRNAVTPDPNPYDLDRLEVLRGPQGTLYGANALNGVVRVLTHDANLDTFELKARTSASSTDGSGDMNYRGDMAINVPIVDEKLAVRAVLGYNDLSGWVDGINKNDINDTQIANARLKVRAQPTENLSIGLSAWASRRDESAPPTADDNAEIANSLLTEQPMAADFTTYGLDIGYDFAAFSISSATSYVDYSNEGDLDLAGLSDTSVSLFTRPDSRVFSQELLLNSTSDGAWLWSLGAFYRDAEDRTYQEWRGELAPLVFCNGKPSCAAVDTRDTSESYAVFGELSRRFFHDRLKWTLGLRHFRDDGTSEAHVANPGQVNSATYEATTPRAVLTWIPSSDLSVYGSYSQGFRSGLPQYDPIIAIAPFYPPAQPDKLHNYEIGAKGSVLNQRVSFEAALYYIDWKDVQQTLLVEVLPNVGGAALINGTSASGFGAEFALTARPAEGLELGATVSWNDLTQDEGFIGTDDVQVFAAGDRLVNSPEYTASGFADYAFPIGGSGLEGRFSASVNYTSQQDVLLGIAIPCTTSPTGLCTTRKSGDDMTIGRANFSLEGADHWTAMLYIDNINNEDGAVTPSFSNDWSSRVRPRTVGLQLEYRYGRR